MVLRRILPSAAVLAVAVAGCGGGDDSEDVRRTVRDFIEATNERDADKWCDELVTDQFREQVTGATGDRSKASCRQLFEAQRGSAVDLIKTGKIEIDGDKATVRTTLERQGQRMPRVFRLQKEDGEWRLASDTGQ